MPYKHGVNTCDVLISDTLMCQAASYTQQVATA